VLKVAVKRSFNHQVLNKAKVSKMIFSKVFLLLSILMKVYGGVLDPKLSECDQISHFLNKILRELNLREAFIHDVVVLKIDNSRFGECSDGFIKNLPEENLVVVSMSLQKLGRKPAVAIIPCDFGNIVSISHLVAVSVHQIFFKHFPSESHPASFQQISAIVSMEQQPEIHFSR
jgi:hypothetical protein